MEQATVVAAQGWRVARRRGSLRSAALPVTLIEMKPAKPVPGAS